MCFPPCRGNNPPLWRRANCHAQLVKKDFLTSWWTGEQAPHNSQWSSCCAWRLAVLPCSLGLLRAASPTGRALRAPPPLPSSIRNGRSASCAKRTSGPPLLIGLTTACFRHRRRPSCAPYQFPLKSCGFSGAETARKRFLLWKMGFSGAKIAPSPPYTPPGTIKARKGFGPLALSLDFLAVYCPAVFCAYLFAIPRKTRPNALDSRGQIGYNIAE